MTSHSTSRLRATATTESIDLGFVFQLRVTMHVTIDRSVTVRLSMCKELGEVEVLRAGGNIDGWRGVEKVVWLEY